MAPQPFHFMTPQEAQTEASARVGQSVAPERATRTQKIQIGSLVFAAAVILSLLHPSGMCLYMIAGGIGGGIALIAALDPTVTSRKSETGISIGVANTLQQCLTGDCPACRRKIIVRPEGTSFTLHCPLCGTPLRYDRGLMHDDRR